MFASGYIPGGVASSLSSAVEKKSPKKKDKTEASELAALFSNPSPQLVSKKKKASETAQSESETGKKRKLTLASENERAENESPNKKKKSLQAQSDDPTERTRPMRRSKEKENRTLFVGNVPLSADKKVIRRIFKTYGVIESIRFRSAAPSDPKMPKKGVAITKTFHDSRHNWNAYVVFEDKTAAKQALAQNGTEIDGYTIRVDIATQNKKHDHNCSVFVGNLPFDVEENPLRAHFVDCGEVANVRLIRDRKMGLGKGFGYVLFKDADAVELALQLDGKDFHGRKLRVQRSTSKPDTEQNNTPNKRNHVDNSTAKNHGSGNKAGFKNRSGAQGQNKNLGKSGFQSKPVNKFAKSDSLPKQQGFVSKSNAKSPQILAKKQSGFKIKSDSNILSSQKNHQAFSGKSDEQIQKVKRKKHTFPSNATTAQYEGIHAQRVKKLKKKEKIKKLRVKKAKAKGEGVGKPSNKRKNVKQHKLKDKNARRRVAKKKKDAKSPS